MQELITQLGIDWKLLLAQVVNFLVLLWVLKRFAFKPLQKFLHERQKRIEKGLNDAEYAQGQREKLRTLRAQIIAAGQKEAEVVLAEARKKGVKEYEEMIQRGKERAQELLEGAKQEMGLEKTKIMHEAKSELGALVMMATERVLREKMDEKKDREIIEKALREIK
ncbi:MAG: F0F1 ATP synthase subunit B [Candidatus Portnoybacteria bacterium]|nr:F0F1 ATP synthase subunit B [Candidatus Portnoybacteria bacterium]